MNKRCKRCNIDRERKNFSKSSASKDGLNSWCKDCKKSYSKEKYKNRNIKTEGNKKCSKCCSEKDISKFSIGNSEDGLNAWCKDCHKIYNKINYIENKERLKPIRKKWSIENKNKVKLYMRERYLKIDKQRLSNYYSENKDEIISKRKSYRETEKYKKWSFESRLRNKWKSKYRDVLRGVIRRIGHEKEESTISILGYSALQFKEHIESKFENSMSWSDRDFHIDHIIPVTAFKEDTPLNIINSLDNLRPLSVEDNLKKNNQIDFDEVDIYIKYLEFLKEDYFNDIKDYIKFITNF